MLRWRQDAAMDVHPNTMPGQHLPHALHFDLYLYSFLCHCTKTVCCLVKMICSQSLHVVLYPTIKYGILFNHGYKG